MPDPTPSTPPAAPWQWTDKLPALVLGLLLLVLAPLVALWSRSRLAATLAVVLAACGLLLVAYSSTVAGWCRPPNVAFGQMQWSLGFWYEPTLKDCIRLVYGGGR